MARRILQWLFFWRREQPKCDLPGDSSAGSTVEETAVAVTEQPEIAEDSPAEESVMMAEGSNAAGAVELPSGEGAPAPGPVLVRSADEPVRAVLPRNNRTVYFTHGCYAAARSGSLRLIAPDLAGEPERASRPAPPKE